MDMNDSWYADWYINQASEEERLLIEKVNDFGKYFEDMLFQSGTNTYELIMCESKAQNDDNNDDDWKPDEFILPDELEYFSYNYFHFKVESLDKIGGYFNQQNQTIAVTPEGLEKDSTILHELIHLHEFVINQLPMFYHDMVYWALYKDLKKKIPELDDIITDHAHLLNGSELYLRGGLHDILFLLKSFDLDIKKGYDLGTVFAYGRDKIFKNYSYIKDEVISTESDSFSD